MHLRGLNDIMVKMTRSSLEILHVMDLSTHENKKSLLLHIQKSVEDHIVYIMWKKLLFSSFYVNAKEEMKRRRGVTGRSL